MLVWVIKMLQHDRIDASKGMDTNKTDASKECIICHYWYFKSNGYRFEPHVCNGCYDILMVACELKSITILNFKDIDYRCVLWNKTKNEAIIC